MYTEQNVHIPADVQLSGTLTFPSNQVGKRPAILIISGSGNGDRNGNLKQIKTNIYKDLSEKLAEWGYVTLRYDKRGVGESKGDYQETGVTELLSDIEKAVQFLKKRPEVDPDKLFLLGHSEGALLAPAICAQQKIQGLMLLCGAALPGEELLPQQVEALIDELHHVTGFKGFLLRMLHVDALIRWQFNSVLNKALNSNQNTCHFFWKKINAKWIRETYHYDVRTHLRRVDCPTLVISGEKDIQTKPEHADEISKLLPTSSTVKVIPNMNHLLRDYSGEHHFLTLLREYKESIREPLSFALLVEIKQWLAVQDEGVFEDESDCSFALKEKLI